MTIEVKRTQILQWVKDGRVFHGTHGALTTPAAFESDLAVLTPDFLLRVPAGIVAVPLFFSVCTEATNAAGLFQVLMRTCANDPGTSNMTTAFTPVNLNTRYATKGSSCTCHVTAGGNVDNTPLNPQDVLRVFVTADIDAITGSAPFRAVEYAPLHGKGVPCIVGEEQDTNAFLVYSANNTSGTGYILGAWAEFTYAEFYAV